MGGLESLFFGWLVPKESGANKQHANRSAEEGHRDSGENEERCSPSICVCT